MRCCFCLGICSQWVKVISFRIKDFFSELLFDKLKFIFIRYNFDVFRISTELVLMFVLYYYGSSIALKRVVKYFGIVLFVLLLIYQIYSAFFQSIYLTPAMFYNDFPMLENGFRIFRTSFSVRIALFVLLGVVALFLLLKLVQGTFDKLDSLIFGKASKLISFWHTAFMLHLFR